MIEFFASCIPPTTTAQMRRFANGHSYKPRAMQDAIATFHQVIAPHKPATPIPGPLRVTIAITWPWRATEKKKNLVLGKIPHDSKPDLDNYIKQFIDELVTWRLIEKDQAISELCVSKYWGDQPGIACRIETIAADPHARVAL